MKAEESLEEEILEVMNPYYSLNRFQCCGSGLTEFGSILIQAFFQVRIWIQTLSFDERMNKSFLPEEKIFYTNILYIFLFGPLNSIRSLLQGHPVEKMREIFFIFAEHFRLACPI